MTNEEFKVAAFKLIKTENGVTAIIDGLFDDLVHELKSEEASNINNSGLDKQLDYIVDSFGVDQALVWLKQNLEN